jgi:hypothetical protein
VARTPWARARERGGRWRVRGGPFSATAGTTPLVPRMCFTVSCSSATAGTPCSSTGPISGRASSGGAAFDIGGRPGRHPDRAAVDRAAGRRREHRRSRQIPSRDGPGHTSHHPADPTRPAYRVALAAPLDRDDQCRPGGGMRWRLRIRWIVEASMRWPGVSSSPWIRDVAPARVLPRHAHYQGSEDVVDRWSSGPVGVGPSSADEAVMLALDRVRGDQAMPTPCLRQLSHEGEHSSVGPVPAWSWVGAAEQGDLVAQHEELDVLGGGRAAHQ